MEYYVNNEFLKKKKEKKNEKMRQIWTNSRYLQINCKAKLNYKNGVKYPVSFQNIDPVFLVTLIFTKWTVTTTSWDRARTILWNVQKNEFKLLIQKSAYICAVLSELHSVTKITCTMIPLRKNLLTFIAYKLF